MISGKPTYLGACLRQGENQKNHTHLFQSSFGVNQRQTYKQKTRGDSKESPQVSLYSSAFPTKRFLGIKNYVFTASDTSCVIGNASTSLYSFFFVQALKTSYSKTVLSLSFKWSSLPSSYNFLPSLNKPE